jgi:hypothetical protein
VFRGRGGSLTKRAMVAAMLSEGYPFDRRDNEASLDTVSGLSPWCWHSHFSGCGRSLTKWIASVL